jgi:hypothetical protein
MASLAANSDMARTISTAAFRLSAAENAVMCAAPRTCPSLLVTTKRTGEP